MGFLFTQIEDKKYYIIRMKNRNVLILYFVILLALFFGSLFLKLIGIWAKFANYIFALGIILVILGFIDSFPIYMLEWKTARDGKTIIQKGNWQLDDNWELKLEK
ncbi:hypothetical protein HYX00_06865 [Candidatus Woesearchaeota archaeon]|nr:hypothetical protein [Candidatus Woesearchaeota archaeon]